MVRTIRKADTWRLQDGLLRELALNGGFRLNVLSTPICLGLNQDVAEALQTIPTKGSLDAAVPVDPLIYRFHEITQVYGTTLKALIHEMFGDGIMSAIDFSPEIERVPDPHGDRVKVTYNGKFLPYKKW